jgi:hypothetical protein
MPIKIITHIKAMTGKNENLKNNDSAFLIFAANGLCK